jgi:benzoyl-CoA reductase/2-hydroxyglutaryl-CoA dehydratase subunit BcrC/BadD/HgdB
MNDKIYKDFLELVGFEENEIPLVLPDWRMAAEKLGLTIQDVEFATHEWIPTYWDINLNGTRKLIGAYIREAIDLCKATEYKKNGVKIVYGILPASLPNYLAIKESGKDKVFVGFPDLFLMVVLNGFFHKVNPFLETAETDGGIVYGCRHCALNKTRIAGRLTNIFPSPDIIWTWGFVCDEGPKTDEYINSYVDPDWNVEITRLPHDTHFGEEDDKNQERVEYLGASMRQSIEKVQDTTGIQITPESLFNAVKTYGRLAFKIMNLQNIVGNADPVPMYANSLALAQVNLAMPFNTGGKYSEEAVDLMTKECRQRIRDGEGVTAKGAPKAGCYFVPISVPWVNKMYLDNGVTLTFSLATSLAKRQVQPPSFEDPYLAASEQWLRGAVGGNLGMEIEDTVEKVESMKPDAMVMGFFDFDRWLGAHQKIMSKLVEERTGVPHYYLESDFYEDRDYSPEALRTRIESMCQVFKMHKMEKVGEAVPA